MGKTRLLIISHSASLYTGTAEVIRNIFVPLLRDYGEAYEVLQVALQHHTAVANVPWPLKLKPTRSKAHPIHGRTLDNSDIIGQLTIPEVINNWRPNAVFLFNDPQVVLDQLRLIPQSIKTVSYVPFDGIPVPREYGALLSSHELITMSEFSKRAYVDSTGADPTRIRVIYAPIDIQRFCPWPRSERNELRKCVRPEWMGDSAFILGWVGRNQWRKQVWLMFEVIALLRKGDYCRCKLCGSAMSAKPRSKHCGKCGASAWVPAAPQPNVHLWIHIPHGKWGGDWNLSDVERYYGLTEGVDIHYTEGCDNRHHLSTDQMAAMYQLWDCLLFLSGGEGFGVPVWEAMSCGIPVIYSNYSSHAELVRNAGGGLGVDGILQPETRTDIMRCISDVYSAIDAVNELIPNNALRDRLGAAGRSYVEAFSRDCLVSVWHHVFQGFES